MKEEILTRGDIVKLVAVGTELPISSVDAVLKEFEVTIAKQLESGGEVRLTNFGTFKTTLRSERTSRNPRTGQPMELPARTVVRFVPGKGLKSLGAGE